MVVLLSWAEAKESAPAWIQDEWRSARYPAAEWYTGFAMENVKSNPNKEKYKAVEKYAQNSLSESITVQIQGTTVIETVVENTWTEVIKKHSTQKIKSTSNAFLAKMETYSWFDKKDGILYGFAAVKKKDLADFYRLNISSMFSFAEKEFALANSLAEQGKKKMALDKIYAIEDSLKNVGNWGFLLLVVDSDSSYRAKERDFLQTALAMKMRLKDATAIYLDVSGHDAELLSAQMQESGCNCAIVANREKADYHVTVRAKLSRCTEASGGAVFCYANAAITVDDIKFHKSVNVKVPEAKGGWTRGDKDKATEEAFKKLISSSAEKIIQTINQ